jgi:hypothetical protein
VRRPQEPDRSALAELLDRYAPATDARFQIEFRDGLGDVPPSRHGAYPRRSDAVRALERWSALFGDPTADYSSAFSVRETCDRKGNLEAVTLVGRHSRLPVAQYLIVDLG